MVRIKTVGGLHDRDNSTSGSGWLKCSRLSEEMYEDWGGKLGNWTLSRPRQKDEFWLRKGERLRFNSFTTGGEEEDRWRRGGGEEFFLRFFFFFSLPFWEPIGSGR